MKFSQFGIQTTLGSKLKVGSLLDQTTTAKHENSICRLHGGQTVRNHHSCASFQKPIQITLQCGLGGRIEKRSGFIHHQHSGIADGHPGNGQQLPFPGAEISTPFAEFGVESLRQPIEECTKTKIPADVLQPLIIDRLIESKIVPNAATEKEGVLQNNTELMSWPSSRILPCCGS